MPLPTLPKGMKKEQYVHLPTVVLPMRHFSVKECSLPCYGENFSLAAYRQVGGNLPQYISYMVTEVVPEILFSRRKHGLC